MPVDKQVFLRDLEPTLRIKTERLLEELSHLDTLIVAFSGGVDSGLLCALGQLALEDRMLAVTVQSPVEGPGDSAFAVDLAQQVGFQHRLLAYDDLQNPHFLANPPDRCYHCKLARFQTLQSLAVKGEFGDGFRNAVIAEGSNADDCMDYRPGARAVAELAIRSPLLEAGFSKAEVRCLAHAMNLVVWDRPSAPCLATRFPYGSPITLDGLSQVARGEAFLREKGYTPVRVRHDRKTARIEVAPDKIDSLAAVRVEVLAFFQELGYTYVMIDLAGYRMGSMNEELKA